MTMHKSVALLVALALACGWSASVSLAAKEPPLKIALFITAPEREGFMEVDRSIADSSKDLRSAFGRMSEVRLVKRRADAEIVLTVSTRGVGSQARGEMAVAFPLGKGVIASSSTTFQNDYWLSTVLQVGPTYRKEFVGNASKQTAASMGAWSLCARMVAEDVQAWIIGNQVQLDGLRWLRNRR